MTETATKLDTGKRKYSLITPAMMDILLEQIHQDLALSNVKDAIILLAEAAHADDKEEILICAHGAVDRLLNYAKAIGLDALDEVTLAMEYGALKPEYGRNNWKKGMEWSRLIDAAQRHGRAILNDEEIDADSGNTHFAHMLASIHMLLGNVNLSIGTNDIF